MRRPDFLITSLNLPNITRVEPGWAAIIHQNMCDCVLSDFRDGIRAARALTSAKCCDLEKREPVACFIPGKQAPRANFMFETHFWVEQKLRNENSRAGLFADGFLTRTQEQVDQISGRSGLEMHGRSRRNITLHDLTSMHVHLSPVLAWPLSCIEDCRVAFIQRALERN